MGAAYSTNFYSSETPMRRKLDSPNEANLRSSAINHADEIESEVAASKQPPISSHTLKPTKKMYHLLDLKFEGNENNINGYESHRNKLRFNLSVTKHSEVDVSR